MGYSSFMMKILNKRTHKESSKAPLMRVTAGFLIVSMASWQTPLMAGELAAPQQVAQPGISLDDKTTQTNTESSTEKKSATSNDFLSSSGTLSSATTDNKTVTAADLIKKVVDVTGTVKPTTSKNNVTTVTVQLNQTTAKTKDFLQKAAGPLQDTSKTSSVTFTMSKDGSRIEKAEFTDGDLKYTLTFSVDSQKILTSTVENTKDIFDMENNYSVEYGKTPQGKDAARITFPNYQNDGSNMIVYSENSPTEVSLKFYADFAPDSFFRTVTITKSGTAIKTINSQLNFDGEPPISEYSATISSAGNIALSFDTSYGKYSAANIGTYSNLYDLIEIKIGNHLLDIQTRENFLLAFEQMMGQEFFTLSDLKDKITIGKVGNDENAPLYAKLNFKGYPLIMTTNIDPLTCETVPLILTPDTNKNGKVDAADRRMVDALKTTVKNFFDPDILNYKDFSEKAIILDERTVFYNGQIINIYGRGSFAYLRYKNGDFVFILGSGKNKRVYRRSGRLWWYQ